MAAFLITLSVMPKNGVLDPAGVAVKNTLNDLGFGDLSAVTLGKCLHLTLTANDEAAAKTAALAMAKNLLAHEAMEQADILSITKIK
ncbi:MAG: phosphoribosylformylglycinamidine synthase subunit PurS [Hydrotalea sp.]|nr:phosphoribosylformylglycinamidine synthase subunit PurS [Hydrotalea sp.]